MVASHWASASRLRLLHRLQHHIATLFRVISEIGNAHVRTYLFVSFNLISPCIGLRWLARPGSRRGVLRAWPLRSRRTIVSLTTLSREHNFGTARWYLYQISAIFHLPLLASVRHDICDFHSIGCLPLHGVYS